MLENALSKSVVAYLRRHIHFNSKSQDLCEIVLICLISYSSLCAVPSAKRYLSPVKTCQSMRWCDSTASLPSKITQQIDTKNPFNSKNRSTIKPISHRFTLQIAGFLLGRQLKSIQKQNEYDKRLHRTDSTHTQKNSSFTQFLTKVKVYVAQKATSYMRKWKKKIQSQRAPNEKAIRQK